MTTARDKVFQTFPKLHPLAQASLAKTADHMMQVIAFHATYDVPMRPLQSEDTRFEHMDDARVAMRVGLIAEEFSELLTDGFGVACDITYAHRDHHGGQVDDNPLGPISAGGKRSGAEIADALGDIVYVCYGLALEMGYDLRSVVEEIHASNLTKLGEDGKPTIREDGKVLKGPNYMKPNIPAALGWETEA